MNNLYIFDGMSEGLLATLSNDNSKRCPFYDAIHTEQLNKDHLFEFSVPADHVDAAHVVAGSLVAFKNVDDEYQLFQIYKTEEEHDGIELLVRAYAEHVFFEMNDNIIEDLRTINDTADSALTDALSVTRWKKGSVADLGAGTTNFYYESSVSAIQKILNTWGGELRKRVTISGNSISSRVVDILARRGSDTGKRFEFTKDLNSIKRTIVKQPKTALYGRGKGEQTETGGYTRRITFADVVWSVANGDPIDKPAGQEWVGDPKALDKFGRVNPETGEKIHRMGTFEDGQEEDAVELLLKTWGDLQERNHPKVTYEMNVIDLERVAGFEHEAVRLGDTVFVIDKAFTPAIKIEARVIEVKRDLENPDNTEIVLGNLIPLFTDNGKKLKQIESKLDERIGVWDEVEVPIKDGDFEEVVPEKPIVTATGAFSKVILKWDADFALYMKHYEIYASTIPSFTPDSSNLVGRVLSSFYEYEGEVNNQYYFKIRGVNRHGYAGAFSDEATAITARIVPDDFDQSRIPEFINTGIIKQAAKPSGTDFDDGQLWIQETLNGFNIWHRWDLVSQRWQKLTPTIPSEIGAIDETTYNTDVTGINTNISKLDAEVALKVAKEEYNTKMGQLDDAITGQNTRITQNEKEIALKASSTEVNAIKGRLSTAETSITANANQIALKASQEELDAAEGRLTTAESNITQNADLIALKVNKAEFNVLDGRVDTAESSIIQNADAIELKVDTTTFNSLKGRVSSAESQITQNADQIALKVNTTTFNALENRMDSAESNITQNATQISSRVTKTTYNIDINASDTGLKARMTTAESTITQQADQIEAKVSKNGVIGSINLSPETFLIDVEKVNINGDLTILNGQLTVKHAAITDAKIKSVGADKIVATTLSAITADLGTVTAGLVDGVEIVSKKSNTTAIIEETRTRAGVTESVLLENYDSTRYIETSTKLSQGYIALSTELINKSTGDYDLVKYINLTARGLFKGGDEPLYISASNNAVKLNAEEYSAVEFYGSDVGTYLSITGGGKVTTPGQESTPENKTASILAEGSLTFGSKIDGDIFLRGGKFIFPSENGITMDAYGNIAPNPTVSSTSYWNVRNSLGDIMLAVPLGLNGNGNRVWINRDLDLANNNLIGVNHIEINDPGDGEGIEWKNGNGWKIVESPYGGGNGAGGLNFYRGPFSIMDLDQDGRSAFMRSMPTYHRTYTYGSNLYITSNGVIGRDSSAKKYKLNIEEVDTENYADKILSLKPKKWFDKESCEQYSDYLTKVDSGEHACGDSIPYLDRAYGLIAEDLVEIGLSEYVRYGEPNDQGIRDVEGILYDRLWTLLIPVIRELKSKVNTLESLLS